MHAAAGIGPKNAGSRQRIPDAGTEVSRMEAEGKMLKGELTTEGEEVEGPASAA